MITWQQAWRLYLNEINVKALTPQARRRLRLALAAVIGVGAATIAVSFQYWSFWLFLTGMAVWSAALTGLVDNARTTVLRYCTGVPQHCVNWLRSFRFFAVWVFLSSLLTVTTCIALTFTYAKLLGWATMYVVVLVPVVATVGGYGYAAVSALRTYGHPDKVPK